MLAHAPRAAIGAERVTVVGAISEQHVALAQGAEHIGGASAVVCLAGRQLERDREAARVNQRVDLGSQPAARAPHASGVNVVPGGVLRTPFLPLAACW